MARRLVLPTSELLEEVGVDCWFHGQQDFEMSFGYPSGDVKQQIVVYLELGKRPELEITL